jgi:glucokinase
MIVGGIDIGGTKISVGLVDETGHLFSKRIMPTSAGLGLANAIQRIADALDSMAVGSDVHLDGIGIGCTGPVNPNTGELAVNSFLPGWEGAGLIRGLEQNFHVPVAIENDADAAALAEGQWGSGKDCGSFIYVTISTGIGGGILMNGRLYRGAEGAHPEIGHHLIDPCGPACFCGAHGCWESLASGLALAHWFNEQSKLLPNGQAPAGALDARQISVLAETGEPLACQAMARAGKYIGIGLANLVTLFTPDRIALGGGMINSWCFFEPIVQQTVRQNCGLVPYQRTIIAPAVVGLDVGLLGAAQVWLQHH